MYRRGKKGAKFIHEAMEKDSVKKLAAEVFAGKKKLKDAVDPVFCLHPPRKGFKDTKSHYPKGDLGRRGDIFALINRMM
jgi:large subunit ribosomal protein L30